MNNVILDDFDGRTKYYKNIFVHNIIYHFPEINIIILNKSINNLISNLDNINIRKVIQTVNDTTHPDYWEKVLELDLIREYILEFIESIKLENRKILPYINTFLIKKYGCDIVTN